MFVGEAACWAVIALSTAFSNARRILSSAPTSGKNSPNSDTLASSPLLSEPNQQTGTVKLYIVALPAMCDILSTTMLNVGLLFVVPSIYQMTRGTVVLFSALFSVWFLRRRVERYKWFALLLVVLGVTVVSLAGATKQDPISEDPPHLPPTIYAPELSLDAVETARLTSASSVHALKTTIGVCIVSAAQILAAAQFVLEEVIMSRYPIAPLELIGYEGVSGLIVMLSAQVIAHITYGSTNNGRGSIFDMSTGWYQIIRNPRIYTASILMMASTGVYNYFALTVTRSLSATHRSTIDTFRTILIWAVGLGSGWESFKWLQLIGFMGLVFGNLLFNEVVRPPTLRSVTAQSKVTGNEEEREHH